jgi:hypothetical protein
MSRLGPAAPEAGRRLPLWTKSGDSGSLSALLAKPLTASLAMALSVVVSRMGHAAACGHLPAIAGRLSSDGHLRRGGCAPKPGPDPARPKGGSHVDSQRGEGVAAAPSPALRGRCPELLFLWNRRPGQPPDSAGDRVGQRRPLWTKSGTLARAGQWDSERRAGSKNVALGTFPPRRRPTPAVRRGAAFASW